MTLPASGVISMDDVNVELGNTTGTTCDMRSLADDFGLSTPDSMDEFYGLSAGDTITLTWGAETPYAGGEHRVATHSGHTSPQIITINWNYDISYTSVTLYFYTSINSTTSWGAAKATIPKTGSGTFSQTLIDYNDVVRVRWDNGNNFKAGCDCWFNNGTVTSGSGTVTGTANWSL